LLRGKAGQDDRVLGQELVELRDELLEMTERQDCAVLCPVRQTGGAAGVPNQNDAGIDGGLIREGACIEAGDGGLPNAIVEANYNLSSAL
jgi:hypothetical protein